MPDLTPAPGSMATSAPSAIIFFTVSGVAATRGSAGSISTGMAIFMGARCSSRQGGGTDGSTVYQEMPALLAPVRGAHYGRFIGRWYLPHGCPTISSATSAASNAMPALDMRTGKNAIYYRAEN